MRSADRPPPSVRAAAVGVFLAAGSMLASACGNAVTTDINGTTGVTVDGAGRPVLVAQLCHGIVAGVTVAGPNRGETPNEIRADLAAAQPLDESFTLDLAEPAGEWTGEPLELPLAADLYIAYAHGGGTADSQLAQVTFTAAQLAELQPGTVQLGSTDVGVQPQRVQAATLDRIACND